MSSSDKPEFLRGAPGKVQRNRIVDVLLYLIPITVIFIGIFASSQYWAYLVQDYNYDFFYTGYPLFVTKNKFLWFDAGYPIYNPFDVFLTQLSRPYDPVIQEFVINALIPGTIAGLIAVVMFIIIGILRKKHNKNEHIYGTARWGTEKDLHKFGLDLQQGVILAQQRKAVVDFKVNPANSSTSLILKKSAPFVGHGGGTNTLMIAPTRSGKGVSSVIPTCLSYPQSMIIFDPKGELYNITGGFRSKFSRVLKFSPVSKETVRFNPMDEIELTEQAFADIGLILANVFEEPKNGSDGNSQFFDNAAKDLLTGLIFHVISCGKYPKSQQNLSGVLEILSIASAQKVDANGEECAAGDVLLDEMINSKHFDRDGNESAYIHRIIQDAASRAKSMHEKVRSDTFSTVFTKMNLFEDPYIKYVTGESDFKIQDFYDSPEPISLYLTVPFSHIDRIAPVFKLIINFILRKFSSGEMRAGEKEKKLKNRIMFLLDEFPVLGAIPFLSKTMGILAGYGINFFIIVQALNQIVDLYGQQHTFLDNCKTVCVFAPGKIEDAKAFSEMLGKESILKESMSSSGSRYALSLDNLNSSAQDIARDLLNPDELMHMSQEYALILNQGMNGYLAKKNVYYMDKRLKTKAYNVDKNGNCISGWPAPYSREEIEKIVAQLPSNQHKETAVYKKVEEGAKNAGVDTNSNVIKIFEAQQNMMSTGTSNEPDSETDDFLSEFFSDEQGQNPSGKPFSVSDFFDSYDSEEDMEEWSSPTDVKDPTDEPPPAAKKFTIKDFSKKGVINETN